MQATTKHIGKARVMPNFRIICPECGAVVLTASAEAAIWELCPACRHHVWDMGDVLMADACGFDSTAPRGRGGHADS